MLQLQLVRFFDDCFTSARRFDPFGIAAVLIIFMTSFRRGDSLKYCF